MLHDLGTAWIDTTEGPETWSPYVIIGHLVHAERANWIPRARFILSQTTSRRLLPYDGFAHFHESHGKMLSVLLDEFGRLRAENLATLAAWRLTDTQLALTGEHPEFGSVTLPQLLATWVVHDLGHIAQTARVMAKQYRAQSGRGARVCPSWADEMSITLVASTTWQCEKPRGA
jgi:hypothetical protein